MYISKRVHYKSNYIVENFQTGIYSNNCYDIDSNPNFNSSYRYLPRDNLLKFYFRS